MFNWYYRFMAGRHGIDQLNFALLIVWAACAFINIFIGSFVFRLIMLVFPLLFLLRALSKDNYRRERENAKFMNVWQKVRGWGNLQSLRIKQFRTHRFFRCPACSATIRIPKRTGRVTVRCTRCGHEFQKRILF